MNGTKIGSQHLMTLYQERETARQGLTIQVAMDVECEGYVEVPAVRFQLVKEPETLLDNGSGKDKFIGSFDSRSWRNTTNCIVSIFRALQAENMARCAVPVRTAVCYVIFPK